MAVDYISYPEGSLGEIENALPLLPSGLYTQLERYAVHPADVLGMDQKELTAAIAIEKYFQCMDESLATLAASPLDEKINFHGTIPTAILKSGNTHIFKGSTWLKLSLSQQWPRGQGWWFTLEQLEHYKLKPKPNTQPTFVFWRTNSGTGNSHLLATALYNAAQIQATDWPVQSFTDEIWFEVLQTYLEEFSVDLLEQQATIIKDVLQEKDVIYRNEAFLKGEGIRYALIIPEAGVMPETEYQQACLTGLSCLVARSRLVQQSKDLRIANLLGFMHGCQLAHTLYRNSHYSASLFHAHNLKSLCNEPREFSLAAKLCLLTDKYFKEYRSEVFEFNQIIEQLIREDVLNPWLHQHQLLIELQEQTKIEDKFAPGEKAHAEAARQIHLQHLPIRELFQNQFIDVLNQEGINSLVHTGEYLPIILSKLDMVMTHRDIIKYPDEYDFYQLIAAPLIQGLVTTFKLLADLEVKWRQFEKEIGNKPLPDPQKDFIIRKTSLEYRKFLKNIFFADADRELILEEAGKILEHSKI